MLLRLCILKMERCLNCRIGLAMLKNEFIIKKYNILYFFVIFYTTCDAFAYFGAVNSLGKLVFFFMLFYLLINNYMFPRGFFFILFFLIFALVLNYFIDPLSISLNFKALIRIFNPFLFFMCLSHVKKQCFSRNLFLTFFRVFYISTYLSLFLGKITGIGLNYRLGRDAFAGFFLGANAIGIMLIIIQIYLLFLYPVIYRFEIFVILICNIIFGYYVFTKSSLVAAFFAFVFLHLFFKSIRRISILIFIYVLIVSIFKDTFFKRILYEILENSAYINILTSNFIHFLFNSREIYFESFFNHLDLNIFSFLQLFIIGFGDYGVVERILPGLDWITETNINLVGRATFEMDFFDLFFCHGAMFTILYGLYLIKYIKFMVKRGGFWVTLLLISLLIHSFLAGHVLHATSATGVLIFLYFFVAENNCFCKWKIA